METKGKYQFIKYENAIINFIFSFSWDVTKFSFNDILKTILNENNSTSGWEEKFLYDRPLPWLIKKKVNATYHPTIRAKNLKVLFKTNNISDSLTISVPLRDKEENITNLQIDYTIRVFENGTGTFTFSVQTDTDLSLNKILLIQHLATSIYYEEGSNRVRNTHALIKLSSIKEKYRPRKDEVEKAKNVIYLAELFSNILRTQKGLIKFFPKLNEKFVDTKNDWQNPYVITVLKTNENDLKRIFASTGNERRNITKEIGAIAVRLTEDNNDKAEYYYKRLRREYIFKALGSYPSPSDDLKLFEMKLRNYSHNNNLFYTYGRRGAIAITDDFTSHPAYFAIPTLVNVLEMMRSRWHLGTIANLLLDETYEKISHSDNIDILINDIYRCRILYGLFLQNPTPYLFDSGAVTEMSDTADKVFWFEKIKDELNNKLDSLDRLSEIIYAKQRLEKFGVNG